MNLTALFAAVPWNTIGKYGLGTVLTVVLLYYYREDVVIPQRQAAEEMLKVNKQQAASQAEQTPILKEIKTNTEQVKANTDQIMKDQQKFPAVAERMP